MRLFNVLLVFGACCMAGAAGSSPDESQPVQGLMGIAASLTESLVNQWHALTDSAPEAQPKPQLPGSLRTISDAVEADTRKGSESASKEDSLASEIERLKNELHKITPKEASARFKAIMSKHRSPPPPRQQKIDHFVVLYMENHAFDNMLGCMNLPGTDGIPPGGRRVPKDPSDPSKGFFNVSCGKADYVCKGGPGYDTFAGKFPKDGTPSFYPYGPQDDKYSAAHGINSDNDTAIKMFSPEQLPVKTKLAKSFGVFNKLYTAVPSASSPNHLFTQSATSCGMHHNGLWSDCNGSAITFPQFTIYDNLRLHNVSFGLYMNSTCGMDGKPCHGEDPHDPDSASAISTPDVAMAGVARHRDRFFSQDLFYKQAVDGTLPAFSWIHPPIQACDHPCNDVAKGERFLKDIYEALRASPAWERTMLYVAYDDAGGYYDHIVPPYKDVPADDAPCHLVDQCGKNMPFDFRRLGLRSTAFLISPWVGEGAVFQEPKGPFKTSQFELTSVAATVKNLFNLSGFLTSRDRWAGSFDELLLDKPRHDAPMHLPTAPEPASPWAPPPGEKRPKMENPPQHCSSWHGKGEQPCRGSTHVNLKQRRTARLLASLLDVTLPDLEAISFSELDQWLTKRWREWMEHGHRTFEL